ncbi:hypothetical protein RD792_010957 [Penstemon davidsonii]|uniref:Beta-glucosidase n=1 Tax=Penstemon davidsonii TaxID=160366 RepID=A0ABR0D3G6_9LAMI|nr:hypothetical protein RD792_010957 [Penstemon davidsonii]
MESKNNLSFISNPNGEELLKNLPLSESTYIKREDFPAGFVFGASGSAYQYEGGATDGGRGLSVWDTFSLGRPDMIEDGSNGSVAIDQYKLYKEDVKILKKTGLDAYRFSISWSRVLPGGKLSAGINKEGIKYYNDLIDSLLAEGIEPYVTIFHWDLPLALDHEYGGFLSKKIVNDFTDFAELCFWEFGDRVKYWITINEAWTYTYKGYVNGTFPPCRGGPELEPIITPNNRPHVGYKSSWKKYPSKEGNSAIEPYIVAHHLILSHASAVNLYRTHFQAYQGGKIGMTNNINWYLPLDEKSVEDHLAARRAVDFMFGWFVSPLVSGDYPESMRERVGVRLPIFTPEEVKLVKGSYDFLGVNYYTTYYAANDLKAYFAPPSYDNDEAVIQTPERNGVPIGPKGGSDWLYIYPPGIYDFLKFAKINYDDPLIYIIENGVDEKNNDKITVSDARHDPQRVKYFHDHLCYVKKALSEGVNVAGYFLWSFADNYEWAEGYTVRFGIFYIDFVNGRLTRFPKRSAIWWTNFLNNKFLRSKTKRQLLEIEDRNTNNNSVKKLRSNN